MTTATETPRVYLAETRLSKTEQKEIEFVQGLFKKTFTSFGESLPRVFWMRDQEGGSAIVSNVTVVAPTEWQQQFQPVSRSYIPDHNVSDTDLLVSTWVVKSKRSVNFDTYVSMITALCDYQKDRAQRMLQQVKGDLLSVEEEGFIRLNDPKGLICEELKQSLTIGPYEDGDVSSPEILAYIDARIYYLRTLIDSGLFEETVFCQTISLVLGTLMSQVPIRQRLASVKIMSKTLTDLRNDLSRFIEIAMMFLLLGCQDPESFPLPASARSCSSGFSSATIAHAVSGGVAGLRARPIVDEGLKRLLESPSGICVQILIFHRVFYRLFPSAVGVRTEFDDNPFFYSKDSCAHPFVPPLATTNQYAHYGKTLVSSIQQNSTHIDELVCIHGWVLELARLVIHSDNMIYITGTSPTLLSYRPLVRAVERTLRAQEDFVNAILEKVNKICLLMRDHKSNCADISLSLTRSLQAVQYRFNEKSQGLQKQLKSSLFRCRNPETSAVLPLEIQDLILQSSILSGKAAIFLNVRPQALDFSVPSQSLQPVATSCAIAFDWEDVQHKLRRQQLSLYKREQSHKPIADLASSSPDPSPLPARVPPPPPPSHLSVSDTNTTNHYTTTSPVSITTSATNSFSPSKLAPAANSRARAYSPTTMKKFLTYLENEAEEEIEEPALEVQSNNSGSAIPPLKGRELTKLERLFIRAMSKNWNADDQPAIVSRHYQIQGELHLHNGSTLLAIECFTRALELLPSRLELASAIASARASAPVEQFSQRSAGLEPGEVACQLLPCQTLKHIDLTANQLGPRAIPSLLAVFRWLPALTTLVLASNNIGDEGLQSISAFLNSSRLIQLDVANNNITSAGAQQLAAVLATNSLLRHLNISDNLILEAGASALCAVCFTNSQSGMEVLDLRNTGVDPALPVSTMRQWIQAPTGMHVSGRWLLVSLSKHVQVELALEENLLPLRARLATPRRDSLAEAVQQIQDEFAYVSPCSIWSDGVFEVRQPQLEEFFEQRLHSHSTMLTRQSSPSQLSFRSSSRSMGPSLLHWFCELEASRPQKPVLDIDLACRNMLRALYSYQIQRCKIVGEWLSIGDHFALKDAMAAFCEEWKEWVIRFYSGVSMDEMDKVANRLTFLQELNGLCSGIRAQVIAGPDGKRRMGPRVPFAPRQWNSLLPLASPQFSALLEEMSNILVQYLIHEEVERVRKRYLSPVTVVLLSAPHLLEVCLLFLFLVYRNPALAPPADCIALSIPLLRANLRENLELAKSAHSTSGQLFMHLLKTAPLEFFFPSMLQVPSLDSAVIDFENPFWDPSGAPRLPRGVARPAGVVHEAGDTNPATLALVCQHQGYLGKARGSGLGYSRRYFILHLDKLYYYKEKTDIKPADVIVLRRETVAQEDSTSGVAPYTFYLITERGGEKRVFAADTESAKHEWINKIKANLNTIAEEKIRAEATAGIRFRGYLWKTGSQGLKTTFKKRFVVLTDDRLRYFASHDAEKPKGEVILSGQTEIMPIHDSPRPNTFYLENEKSGRKFYFAAETDYKDWLNAITICCADLRNEMRTSASVTENDDVILSGYLLKMAGDTSLTKSYQKRFFRLYYGKLIYYGKENEAKKGEICLTPRSVVTPLNAKEGKRAFVFSVSTTPTDRKYLLAAEDAQLYLQWKSSIEMVITGMTRRADKPISKVFPTLKGYLGKTGSSGLKNGFSRRYCILTQDRMQYFKTDTDRKPKGEILIGLMTTCNTNLNGLPHAFQWINPDRTFFFQCESVAERNQWVQAITSRLKDPSLAITAFTTATTVASTASVTTTTIVKTVTASTTSLVSPSASPPSTPTSTRAPPPPPIKRIVSTDNKEDERDKIVVALGGMDELCSGIDELAVQRDPQKLKDFVYLHGSLFALAQSFILLRKLVHALENPNFLRRASALAHTNNALALMHGLLGATKQQLVTHFEVFQDFRRKDKCVPALFARLLRDIESMLRVMSELNENVCKVLPIAPSSVSSSTSSASTSTSASTSSSLSSPSSATTSTSFLASPDIGVSPWLESLEVELAVFVNTVNFCLPPNFQISPQIAPRPPTTTPSVPSSSPKELNKPLPPPPPPPQSQPSVVQLLQDQYSDVNPQVLTQILTTPDLKERASKLASLGAKLQTQNARAAVGVYALAIECDPSNHELVKMLAKAARASMKRLLFHRSSLQDGDLSRVLLLIQDHVIVELDVSNNFLGPIAIAAFCVALRQCEQLKQLSFAGNRLGDDEHAMKSLAELLHHHPSLEQVNLSSLQITDLGVTVIAPALRNDRTLVSLDLSSNPIGDTGVKTICEALRINAYSTVERLNFSRTLITNVGARCLRELLACAAALEEIGLGECKVDQSVVDIITTKLAQKRKPFEALSGKQRTELREFRQTVLQESVQTFFACFFDSPLSMGAACRALRAFCVPQKCYQLVSLISDDPHSLLVVYEGLICLARLHYGLCTVLSNPQAQADILGCSRIPNQEVVFSCDGGLWSFTLEDWGEVLRETANKLFEQCLRNMEDIFQLSIEDPESVVQTLSVLVKFHDIGINDLAVASPDPHLLEILTLRNWNALPLCSAKTGVAVTSLPAFLASYLSFIPAPVDASTGFKENSSVIALHTISVVQKRWLAVVGRWFQDATKSLRGNADEVVAILQGVTEEQKTFGPIYFFTKFLAGECSEENMEFWHAVNRFQKNHLWGLLEQKEHNSSETETAVSELWEQARSMLTTFIGAGASRQVNIASTIESDAKKAVLISDPFKRVHSMKAIFFRARDEIVKLLTADSFRRFIKSPFWAEFLATGETMAVTLCHVKELMTDLQLVVTNIIPLIDERWKILQFFLTAYEEHAMKLVDTVQNAVSPVLEDVTAAVHFLDWTAELYSTLSSLPQPPNVLVNDYKESLHTVALVVHRQGLKRRIMAHINALLNRTWAEMQKNVMALANSEKNAAIKGTKSDGFNTNAPLRVFDCIKSSMSQCLGVVSVSPRAEARLAQLGVHAFDLFSHHLGSLLTEAQITFSKCRLPPLHAKLQFSSSHEEPAEGDEKKFDFEAVLNDPVEVGDTKQTMAYIYAQASNADLLWSLLDEMKKDTLIRIAEAKKRVNGDDDVEDVESSMFHEFDECFLQCRALLAPCLDIIVSHSFMRFGDVFNDIFLPSWFADATCTSTQRMLEFLKQFFKHFNTVTTTEGALDYSLSKKVLEELMNEYAARFMTYRDDEPLTYERALHIHTHINAVMALIRQHFDQLLDARSSPWIQSEIAVLECIRALILLSHAQNELFDGQFEKFRSKFEVPGSRFRDLPGLSPRIVLQECMLNRHHPHIRFQRSTSL